MIDAHLTWSSKLQLFPYVLTTLLSTAAHSWGFIPSLFDKVTHLFTYFFPNFLVYRHKTSCTTQCETYSDSIRYLTSPSMINPILGRYLSAAKNNSFQFLVEASRTCMVTSKDGQGKLLRSAGYQSSTICN